MESGPVQAQQASGRLHAARKPRSRGSSALKSNAWVLFDNEPLPEGAETLACKSSRGSGNSLVTFEIIS